MENVIITAILTIGAVILGLLISKNWSKARDTNAEELKRKVQNYQQKVSYWKGKFNALIEESEEDSESSGLLDDVDLSELAGLDIEQLEGIPIIGKILKNPKYRKMATDFLTGLQAKKGGGSQGSQGPGDRETDFLS